MFSHSQKISVEQRKEVSELITACKLSISPDDFNFSLYQELMSTFSLPKDQLCLTEDQKINEQNYYNSQISITDIQLTKIQATKLALVFKNLDEVKNYFIRYLNLEPNDANFVELCCSFELPKENSWNISLWQKIIANATPAKVTTLVFRLLSHADKIENYLNTHSKIISIKIEEKIIQVFKQRYAKEYDEHTIKNRILSDIIDKKINRSVHYYFDLYLRNELNLPSTDLNEDKRKIAQRNKNLIKEDLAKKEEIKKQIIAENQTTKKDHLGNITNIDDYIAFRLGQEQKLIAETVKSITRPILHEGISPNKIAEYTSACLYA